MSTHKESSAAIEIKEDESREHEHVHGPNCSHSHSHSALKPITRESVKVGRNDPCPCGSQKKFKKCCGI